VGCSRRLCHIDAQRLSRASRCPGQGGSDLLSRRGRRTSSPRRSAAPAKHLSCAGTITVRPFDRGLVHHRSVERGNGHGHSCEQLGL
jgi:hypothetical protein